MSNLHADEQDRRQQQQEQEPPLEHVVRQNYENTIALAVFADEIRATIERHAYEIYMLKARFPTRQRTVEEFIKEHNDRVPF